MFPSTCVYLLIELSTVTSNMDSSYSCKLVLFHLYQVLMLLFLASCFHDQLFLKSFHEITLFTIPLYALTLLFMLHLLTVIAQAFM